MNTAAQVQAGSKKLIAFRFARGRVMRRGKWLAERCEAHGDGRPTMGRCMIASCRAKRRPEWSRRELPQAAQVRGRVQKVDRSPCRSRKSHETREMVAERCEAQGDDRASGGAVHDTRMSCSRKARTGPEVRWLTLRRDSNGAANRRGTCGNECKQDHRDRRSQISPAVLWLVEAACDYRGPGVGERCCGSERSYRLCDRDANG